MCTKPITHVLNILDVVDASDELKTSTEFPELPVVDVTAADNPAQTPTVKSTLFKRPESTDKLRGYTTLYFPSLFYN